MIFVSLLQTLEQPAQKLTVELMAIDEAKEDGFQVLCQHGNNFTPYFFPKDILLEVFESAIEQEVLTQLPKKVDIEEKDGIIMAASITTETVSE